MPGSMIFTNCIKGGRNSEDKDVSYDNNYSSHTMNVMNATASYAIITVKRCHCNIIGSQLANIYVIAL